MQSPLTDADDSGDQDTVSQPLPLVYATRSTPTPGKYSATTPPRIVGYAAGAFVAMIGLAIGGKLFSATGRYELRYLGLAGLSNDFLLSLCVSGVFTLFFALMLTRRVYPEPPNNARWIRSMICGIASPAVVAIPVIVDSVFPDSWMVGPAFVLVLVLFPILSALWIGFPDV